MADKVVQLGVFALVVAGFVALTVKGAETAEYVGMVTPVLAAVFVVNHLTRQDQTINEIHKNTNGVLTERIRKAVQQALDERGGS
ncbi:hypothetical protein [Streptomyces johnsoniae]|uniref:Holin n=1 Tax=Streptomyces johnsoniae TaxID=3075532 RepID=A0ABU2RZZ3_9ACTN|nr:hypothetical protein [Streptomyces sp. DSM 41886]MDT0442329.1 hypothetical protein [Streptomyces sp. DSM 41886]